MNRRQVLSFAALAAATPAVRGQASRWPEKPVRIVVPFAAGGSTDTAARMVAPRLAEALGQQFIVENRPGAGGTVGAEAVARANPDGYTMVITASTYATGAALYKMPYDPVKGIAPISMLGVGPMILAVHPSVKATNLKEYIELARSSPAGVTFGSSGIGSILHLSGELFRQMTRSNMVHVPYKGDAPAIADLVGGQIQSVFSPALVLSPQLRAGRVRPLAVTSEQRFALLPDLPAVAEVLPGFSAITWYGMWAPLGTPNDIIMRLNGALGRILAQPDVIERMRADGVEATHTSPEEFGRILAREIATWTKVVQAGNIKVD